MWLLIHAGIKSTPYEWKGPSEVIRDMMEEHFFTILWYAILTLAILSLF